MTKRVTPTLRVFTCCLLIATAGSARLATVAQSQSSPTPEVITAGMVKRHIVTLAADNFEGRGAGYRGERKAAAYIANEFKKIGLKPIGDLRRGRRNYFQDFEFQPSHPVTPWEVLSSRNVLGVIEGGELKKEIVVVGAHYDGQGRAGQADPLRAPAAGNSAKDEIWNSANDNAASVAAIIEIARAIKSQKLTPRRSILFIAFGAEEHGMAGSMYYVAHPVFPLTDHVAMINLEKLGRAPEKQFSLNGVATSAVWSDVLKAALQKTNTRVAPNVPFVIPDSDHYPFGASRVPAVMFYVSSNLDDAHQPQDTADKIDFDRTAAAARFVMTMLLDIADRQMRPEYVPSPIPDLGLIGHLATNAEADARGLRPPRSGLKVTGVIPGLPAWNAGLQPGDFIVEFANYRFSRSDAVPMLMQMYREILEGKRGSSLPAKVIRDQKQLDLIVKLR